MVSPLFLVKLVLVLVLLLSPLTLTHSNHARADAVAILYPEIREPFLEIFLTIAEGIEEEMDIPVELYAVSKMEDTEMLRKRMQQQDITGVVSLGSRALRILPSLDPELPSVVGAVTIIPNGHHLTGITRSPSPRHLFDQLRLLQPKVKRVCVVRVAGDNPWLIDQARLAAPASELSLDIRETTSVHQAANQFRQLLNEMDSERDALWLPQGGGRIDRALMNKILEVSWNRKLVVFSSSFADVKRGVLFSLYPDNKAMGQQLGRLLEQRQQNQSAPATIYPVEDLLTAVNLRTAEHLGLHFSHSDIEGFHYVYPSR